jgi:carbon monoxide dehydrogenase subunit G
MQLEHEVAVEAPLEQVWAFFKDVPAVASCMPGVERIEAIGPDQYVGAVRLKVGPLGFTLTGNLVRQAIDDANRTATLGIAAEDRRLASTLSATLRLSLASEGETTRVRLETDANVVGKIGQFGQGVIKLAADGVMKQFAGCVRERLTRSSESVAATAPADGN